MDSAPNNGATAPITPSSFSTQAPNPNLTLNAENKTEAKLSTSGFSAATQMLIDRARGQVGGGAPLAATGVTLPPNYEEMKRRVMEGMKTSMNMELPPLPPPGKRNTGVRFPGPGGAKRESVSTGSMAGPLAQGGAGSSASSGTPGSSARAERKPARGGSARRGRKRKRVVDEESETGSDSGEMSGLGGDSESDDSVDMTNFPAITQSGRMIVKPTHFNPASSEAPPRKRNTTRRSLGKNAEQALCKTCGRGYSPASNMIVFCDGCNTPYHQMCHDPQVADEAVQDETKDWFCNDCQAKRSKNHTPRNATPATASPASENNKSSGWAGKSAEEKRAYLSCMPQAHLVSLLLNATLLYPDIPILPAPPALQAQSQPSQLQHQQFTPARRTTIYPQQPFPPSAASVSGLFARAEANPGAPINFIRKIQANGSVVVSGSASTSTSPFATSFNHASPIASTSPTTGFTSSLNYAAQGVSHPASSSKSEIGTAIIAPVLSTNLAGLNAIVIPMAPALSATTATVITRPPEAPSAPSSLPAPLSVLQSQVHSQPKNISQVQAKFIVQPQQKVSARDENDDQSRESTPASPPYPRPGNGLMAKLPPDHEDLEWLVGEEDNPRAFSHTIFAKEAQT